MKKVLLGLTGTLLILLSSHSFAAPSAGQMICRSYNYAYIDLIDIPRSGINVFWGVFYKGKWLEKHNEKIYSWNHGYLNTWNGDFIQSNLRPNSYLAIKINGKWKFKRC